MALCDMAWLLSRPEWTRNQRAEAIRPGKVMTGDIESTVVFLLGIRINRWRGVRQWMPLLFAIPAMLRDLAGRDDSGLLGYRLLLGPGPRQAMLVQYWRSSEDLHRFARQPAGPHRSAQRRFWWNYGSGAAVGVWHELVVPAEGAHHAVYGNMPPTGLGALHPVRAGQWWARETSNR
jgi:fumigallin biosynthesis monooxygenase-like protein